MKSSEELGWIVRFLLLPVRRWWTLRNMKFVGQHYFYKDEETPYCPTCLEVHLLKVRLSALEENKEGKKRICRNGHGEFWEERRKRVAPALVINNRPMQDWIWGGRDRMRFFH